MITPFCPSEFQPSDKSPVKIALKEVGDNLRFWPDAPPLIIDESDGEPDALPRALAFRCAPLLGPAGQEVA